MAFLEINGYEICTIRGGDMVPVEIGDRKRAYDGSARKSVRAIKREWDFASIRDSEKDAEAIRRTIRGDGDVWPLDLVGYTAKGNPEPTNVIRTFNGAGADGDPAYWVQAATYVPMFKHGVGSVSVDDPADNICPADSRDAENAPTGYGGFGNEVLSADTSNFWQGAKSLKCVTDANPGTNGGFETSFANPGGGSAGQLYWGTVWVKGDSGGESILLSVRDATNSVIGSIVSFTFPQADTWYRLSASVTVGGLDCTQMAIRVNEAVNGSNITWYSDGFQLEQNTYPTSWYDGDRSSDGVMGYFTSATEFLRGRTDFTLNFWSIGSAWFDNALRTALAINTAAGEPDNRIRIYLQNNTSTIQLRLDTARDGVFATSLLSGTQSFDYLWHMWTVVLRTNFETGENERELYYDGLLVASDAVGSRVPVSTHWSQIFIGGWGSTNELNGAVDDITIVPFAAPAAQVLAWYNMGQAMSLLPYVYATGDFITEDSVEVMGEIKSVPYRPFWDGTLWRSNAREVAFKMTER